MPCLFDHCQQSSLCFYGIYFWLLSLFVFTFIVSFIVYIFLIFIVFLIWKGICVCVKGKKNTDSALIIRNNSKSVLLKVLARPPAGSPRRPPAARLCSHYRKRAWLSGPSALPTPGHTQARPTGDCCSHLACPLSPQTPSVFVQAGKGSV